MLEDHTPDRIRAPFARYSHGVEIPPGVIHSAKGDVLVLVVGIPSISDEDTFLP